MSTEDKMKNTAQDLKGKAKEAAGAVSGDPQMKREGHRDQHNADLKQSGEKVKDALTD